MDETPTFDDCIDDLPETDASADWQAEYAAQGVDPNIRPDGGRPGLEAGDRAIDTKPDGQDEVLVVETHDGATAAGYVIDELGETVADVNPGYPARDRVVDGVYVDDVDDRLDGWRGVEDLRDAVEFGVLRSYSFPASRLRPVDKVDSSASEEFL